MTKEVGFIFIGYGLAMLTYAKEWIYFIFPMMIGIVFIILDADVYLPIMKYYYQRRTKQR